MSLGEIVGFLASGTLPGLIGTPSFEDAPDAAKPFGAHYQKYVLPHVYAFEESRQTALRKMRWRLGMSGAALVVLAVVLVWMLCTGRARFQFDSWSVWGLLTFSALSAWIYVPAATYKADVKDKIYPRVFSFFGDNFAYARVSPLSVRTLEETGLIPSYDDEKSEDYVKGIYGGVGIELFESTLTETRGSGKSRQTVTVFRGMFILLDMNKNFSGKTVVRRDGGAIGNWLSGAFGSLEAVRLEDPVFEKQFEVYSSDQIEARYLLTTSFMERLLGLSKRFGSKGIQCCFYDRKILLMVPTARDRFEVGSIFEPTTFVEECQGILGEMQALFGVIDYLKLNQRTGL